MTQEWGANPYSPQGSSGPYPQNPYAQGPNPADPYSGGQPIPAGQPYPPQTPGAPYPPGPYAGEQSPADPYAGAQGAYGGPGYPGGPGFPGGETPKKKGINPAVIIAIVVALIGIGVGVYFLTSNKSTPPPPPPASTAESSDTPGTTDPSDDPTDVPTDHPTSSSTPLPPSTPTIPLGQSVTVTYEAFGPVQITITGNAMVEREVSEYYSPDEGNVFIVVPAIFANPGEETALVMDEDLQVQTTSGVVCPLDGMPTITYKLPSGENNPLWLILLEPGESLTGVLVFQIPEASLSGAMLGVGRLTESPALMQIGL